MPSDRASIERKLRSALAALVEWQDKIDDRRGGRCACLPQGRARSACPQCHGRYLLGKKRAGWTLYDALRRLARQHEARYGRCGECIPAGLEPCRLCAARRALTLWSQLWRGVPPSGVPHQSQRLREGDPCPSCGRPIDGDNLVRFRSHGKEAIGCRACRRRRDRDWKRARYVHKRIPGMCKSGRHPIAPGETCKPCRRQWDRSRAELRRLRRARRAA